MHRQPNILLIMADQLADPWLDLAVTPAIDRLIAGGVRFRSCSTPSPLCAPARFAMLAGRRNSRIGAYDNASEFASSTPTFVHHLRAGGYQTALVGKMHFVGADQLHGYEERLTTDIYPADFGWTPDWSDPDGRFDWWFHNMDSVTHAGVASVSNQLDFDDEVGHRALRKLRDLARSEDDRPWFLTVSFTHPHDPYVARREHWDRYDHATIPMPTVPAPAEPDPHSARLARVIAADVTDVTDEQVRTARHAYLANASYVDDHVARLLDTLTEFDLDDTIVVFTADHGDLLGERGLWYKMSFFEPSVRVPFVIHAPGRFAAADVDAPVGLLDLAPTLLDLAGVAQPPPGSFDGTSVAPILAGGPAGDRTVVGEYLGEGAVAPIFMIRRDGVKFVWSAPDPPQLYDVVADPDERHNLADDDPATTMAFSTEIHERWDVAAVDAAVRASQAERRLVDRALRAGRHAPWDHQPVDDAANQYMRNHLDLNDVEAGRRR